jgi:hypothetical protein
MFSSSGVAQQLQTPSLPTGLPTATPSVPLSLPTQVVTPPADDRTRSNSNALGTDQTLNGTLTASQIINIVQARPELIVDIKQVMADYLEQQGSQVQVDSITDDMLYKGIASDANLRGAISVWI